MQLFKVSTVGKYISADGKWTWPYSMKLSYPRIIQYIEDEVPLCLEMPDERVWTKTKHGIVTVREIYEARSAKKHKFSWGKRIWRCFIPPNISIFVWRAMYCRLPVEEMLRARGITSVSYSSMCDRPYSLDEADHLLITCDFARRVEFTQCSFKQLQHSNIGK